MAEFNVNDKFDPSKGYNGIRFGSDSTLLETELNELQKIQEHARAEIVRTMAHSGVLAISPNWIGGLNFNRTFEGELQIDSSITNRIRLNKQSVLINGHKIFLTEGDNNGYVNLWLPEPPTEGTRDDLVFLEAWFEEVDSVKDPAIKDARIGEETSRRTKLNWRIRTVAGVDFTAFPNGFHNMSGAWASAYQKNIFPTTTADLGDLDYVPVLGGRVRDSYRTFMNVENRNVTRVSAFSVPFNDAGILIAGAGDQYSKDLLKTADGYVYAIPLFRVKRRNSGGYSQNNGNGARVYYSFPAFSPNLNSGEERVLTKTALGDTLFNAISVGDYHFMSNAYNFTVIGKTSDTVTVKSTGTGAIGGTSGLSLQTPNRPDGKYANIIHQDDIIDLRHKVSLTGVNYDQLLEENFDKLLRGELRTKEGQKMLKTYHGVPKTPIDANHVFYASFDGSIVAERGGAPTSGTGVANTPSPTGLGYHLLPNGANRLQYPVNFQGNQLTVEFFVKTDEFWGQTDTTNWGKYLFVLTDSADSSATFHFGARGASNGQSFIARRMETGVDASVTYNVPKPVTPYSHIRVTINNANKTFSMYVNGKLAGSSATTYNVPVKATGLTIGGGGSPGWSHVGVISDFSLSNIDRGTTFATIPKDIADGYAVIDKAFNMQRRNLSDAQTSQYTTSIAKPKSQVSDRGITVEKGTGVNQTIFETGDKIKVKGIAGEVITGVIDTDTALARVVKKLSITEFRVDSVAKLAVGDVIRFYRVVPYNTDTTEAITAIDAVNNTITIAKGSGIETDGSEVYIVETTASTSSPVVKFGDGDTVKTVAGTWTNLGTNEATFTLGENVNLDTEDVFIEYSLNSPNGQGGIPEVLTEVLEGQYLGQKYVKGAPVIRADFRGKVAGSNVENPHLFRYITSTGSGNTTLLAPNNALLLDAIPAQIQSVTEIGGVSATKSATNAGGIAQQVFSFDLIAEVERQFGRIPKATKAEKVQWIKDNIAVIRVAWNGYGSSVGGNKATVTLFNVPANNYHPGNNSTVGTVSKVTYSSSLMNNTIDNNGFVHSLAYAEPSDGVTPSVINTDYIELEIEFKSPTGYDALTPEKPFHNGTQKNFFFIRKETKEIEMMFNCDEDFGVVTWGNYVPYQGVGSSGTDFKIIKVMGAFITTVGTGARSITANEALASKPLSVHLPISTPDYLLLNDNVLVGNDGVDLLNTATSREINSGLKLRKLPIGGYRSLLPVGKMSRLTTYPNAFSLRGFNTSSSEGYQAVYTNFMLNQYVSTLYPRVVAIPMLVKVGSKLCLFVTTDTSNTRSLSISTFANSSSDLYELPGRMLVKEDN